ncbi:MAG: hypothetical protein LBS89_06155, partial [Zoogloeaceae bacterium]|nr:hypothetical protein [Zoogloeaceae bacterium]
AETLNFVFRHLEWDAEADLAGLIGDMPARRLTLLGQALRQRLRQSGASLLVQMRAYAHDKTGLLPTPAYLAAFAREVGALRADLAALEQRLAQLERHR